MARKMNTKSYSHTVQIKADAPKDQRIVDSISKLLTVQIQKAAKQFEDTFLTGTSAMELNWPPEEVRCNECSAWKIRVAGSGTYFKSSVQQSLQKDCKYCAGTGLAAIPLEDVRET